MERNQPSAKRICVEVNGKQNLLFPPELKKLTGVEWIFSVKMQSERIRLYMHQLGRKLEKKHHFCSTKLGRFLEQFASPVNLMKKELRMQQLWRGEYYREEIMSPSIPDVILRWINPQLGWGVFAARPFKVGEYIAEYTGILRKKQKSDRHNAYCFQYMAEPGSSSRLVIDAKEYSGIARYINHSAEPNLEPILATIELQTHLIFLTKKPIQIGQQLCYDYGPTYWKKREAPQYLR